MREPTPCRFLQVEIKPPPPDTSARQTAAVSGPNVDAARRPTGQNAFHVIVVPRFVHDQVFELHLERDLAAGGRLQRPFRVVGDRPLFDFENVKERLRVGS